MTPCALPFCDRKAKNRYYWWFCSRHWPLVSRRCRKRLRAVTRTYHEAACANRIPVILQARYDRALNAAVVDAIEGAHFV
ncbi:MAG: hypothetical protein GOVbin258_3 [Prokaryotic dsDNA virus sp.]|nr:hypothetical protein [Hyphomonadaceae bacterium]QDP63675.1 MAG: hypothetical protein GOVbin258_3 [Prokaryotic dsDNA virus sp.]